MALTVCQLIKNMVYKTLISTEQLQSRLHHDNIVIVDCRFELGDPNAGFKAYQKGHIPSAVYAHLDNDLSSTPTETTGRHPLPNLDEFKAKLGIWGIDADKQVVVYDQFHGAFASRLWWMLRYLGHEAVAVLNGGFPKWEQENRPTDNGIHQNQSKTFEGNPQAGWTVSASDVEQNIDDQQFKLIDSRSSDRFRGENETIDPAGGHIPGAINHFFGNNVDENGVMKSPETLRQQFEALIDQQAPSEAIFYCGSGVSACQNLLAMSHAGLEGAKLYVGSWSEWLKDPDRPISTDAE